MSKQVTKSTKSKSAKTEKQRPTRQMIEQRFDKVKLSDRVKSLLESNANMKAFTVEATLGLELSKIDSTRFSFKEIQLPMMQVKDLGLITYTGGPNRGNTIAVRTWIYNFTYADADFYASDFIDPIPIEIHVCSKSKDIFFYPVMKASRIEAILRHRLGPSYRFLKTTVLKTLSNFITIIDDRKSSEE